MSDPLSLVRQATISGEAVNYADGQYQFGNQNFHELTKTAFKRTLRTSDDYFYSLRDIIFFLENAQLPIAEYRRKAVENKITAIVEQDRNHLQKYLTGEIDSCPQIDINIQNSFKAKPSAAPKKPSSTTTSSTMVEGVASGQQVVTVEGNSTAGGDSSATTATTTTGGMTTAIASSIPANVKDSGRKSSSKRKHAQVTDFTNNSLQEDSSQTRRGHNFMAQILSSTPQVSREVIEGDKAVMAKVRAEEYAPYNRHSVMNAREKDFLSALKLFNDRILKPKEGENVTSPLPINSPQATTTTTTINAISNNSNNYLNARGGSGVSGRSQIIIVPNSLSSLINIFNAKAFLSEGIFKVIQSNQLDLNKKPKVDFFIRRVNEQEIHYRIIDDTKILTNDDWQRVVAVFVTGQLWQIKAYKWSNPTELFHHIPGFHLMMEGSTINPDIASWNCKILKLNQFKEHVNASASTDFWMRVDDFVRLRKNGLVSP
eukprot:gene4799-5262_t